MPTENYLKLEKVVSQFHIIDNFFATSKIQFSKAEIESELQNDAGHENPSLSNVPIQASLSRSLSKKSSFKEKILSPFFRKNKP